MRVYPWRSPAEWDSVAALVQSDEPSLALPWLRVWRSRGQEPGPVEWTRDVLGGECLALVRVVNGVADSLQGARAHDMRVLVRELGMADVLVDVRHALTHGRMPSAGMLERAREAALSWLVERYWSQGHTQVSFTRSKVEEEEEEEEEEDEEESWSSEEDSDRWLHRQGEWRWQQLAKAGSEALAERVLAFEPHRAASCWRARMQGHGPFTPVLI